MTRRIFGTGGILAILLSLSGCGGSSSSPSTPAPSCTGGTPPGLSDTASPLPVYESTCAGTVNIPVVTLHICVPGTSTCQDVPNILVDFGSTGLRLSHTLPIAGELPQEQIGGQPLYECYYFESGYNYGPVVTATVTLDGQSVQVPVQISNSSLSAPCGNIVSPTSPSAPFQPYYNGILGVLFPQYDDLDSSAIYLEGSQSSVVNPSQSETVQNPVYLLPISSNDGVLLTISTKVSSSQGAPSFTGTLTFGALSSGTGTQLQTDRYGEITATYPSSGTGSTHYSAFFDTGSNGFFFDNSLIPQCTGNDSGFFCGNASSQTVTFSSPTSSSSNKFTLHFSIVSAQTLFATGNTVFSTLGGFQSDLFDAGFPAFLYGHNIGLSWTSTCSPSSNPGQGCFVIQ